MESTQPLPEPPPLPKQARWSNRYFILVLFFSLAVLYTTVKSLLAFNGALKPVYAELDVELPAGTVYAMGVIDGILPNGRLVLGLPPLVVAVVYMVLGPWPSVRRTWLVGVGLCFTGIMAGLLGCLVWPLFGA